LTLDQQEHCYEELREVVINVMLGAHRNGVDRFEKLLERTAVELGNENGADQGRQHYSFGPAAQLHPNDSELVLEIVWDLFRQGIITFGRNAADPGWPWLRLSRFGECALQQHPYRFHNKAEFLKVLESEALDVSSDSIVYLREAVAAFYANCLLAASVMLGLAAESEFLRLLDAAKNSITYGKHFSRIGDGLSVRAKMLRFQVAMKPLLPEPATRDLSDALNTAQAILRAARRDSETSGVEPLSRDQVYVFLQLFAPFAEQLTWLRRELTEADYPRRVSSS